MRSPSLRHVRSQGFFVKYLTKPWHVGMLLALSLVIGACGGDDGTADTEASSTNNTNQSELGDDAAADTTAPVEEPADDDGDEPVNAGPVNVATVTVGDKTYEADVTPGNLQRCDSDFFNAFWALGGGMELFLPPPDDPNHSDAPRVVVKDDASGLEWIADPSASSLGSLSGDDYDFKIPEGDSQVDSFSVDGNTATGSATFIEQEEYFQWTGGGDQPEPVQGTFTVTCASD